MTEPSSTAVRNTKNRGSLIRALVLLAATACIILLIWVLRTSQSDPYLNATLALQGSEERGGSLFRMNCVGCHGIAAQGLVGPDLHSISGRLRDVELIDQVVSGRTPPMPSFQMEPQSMADLLAYLHSLN